MSILEKLLFDDIKPNRLTEVEWLMDYIKGGNVHGDPLFLSLGEDWSSTPQGLIDKIKNAPAYAHGYQLSMYGLPELRKHLKTYIKKQYGLEDNWHQNQTYELSVAQTGTRAVMHDYALWLQENFFFSKNPTIIMAAPGWDYSGVFKSLGYNVDYFYLKEEDGFKPNIEALIRYILNHHDQNNQIIFALNAQQNPTAINWSAEDVKKILDVLVGRNIPVLVDDAYFAICEPSQKPTATLPILLEILDGNSDYPWLYVRSLGKQFSCNGWGIGFYLTSQKIVEILANTYQVKRHYNMNGISQYAMSEWILTQEAESYLKDRNQHIAKNRSTFLNGITQSLGFPEKRIFRGTCTSFQIFPIPKNDIDTNSFIKRCLFNSGILFTDAWPVPYNSDKNYDVRYARIYLGVSDSVIQETLERLIKAKIFYQ